jgi:hypothetical protein
MQMLVQVLVFAILTYRRGQGVFENFFLYYLKFQKLKKIVFPDKYEYGCLSR